MNRKVQINLILIITLVASLFFVLQKAYKLNSNKINVEKLNLALRQTAHNMLLAVNDSTSRINEVIHF